MISSLLVLSALPVQLPPTFKIASQRTLTGVRAVSIACAPTGAKVAIGIEDGTIRIVDATTGQTIKTLKGHTQAAQALAWSPDGKTIVSGDETARIFFWSTKTWAKTKEMRPHTRPVQALAYNRKGNLLVSTGQDDKVMLWALSDTKKPKLDYAGKGANLYSARFVGASDNIIMGTLTASARLITPAAVTKMSFVGHNATGINDVDVNAAGTRTVTAGRDNTIGLFETASGKRLGYFRGHTDWVQRVLFSPNGKWIASSSSDGTVRVWNINNFLAVAHVAQQRPVGSPLGFTGDGKYFITVDSFDYPIIHKLGLIVK
ncbi:MAG: WD40 repeat domain-containing protein [Fimbriimonadaceae bacterium]